MELLLVEVHDQGPLSSKHSAPKNKQSGTSYLVLIEFASFFSYQELTC